MQSPYCKHSGDTDLLLLIRRSLQLYPLGDRDLLLLLLLPLVLLLARTLMVISNPVLYVSAYDYRSTPSGVVLCFSKKHTFNCFYKH